MIHETNDEFPFSKLILCKPIATSSGSFFIRYSLNEHPLYIQTPKCYIKQIHTKAGKKMYADLVFQQDNEAFLQWMENLENKTQQILYDHRQQWFQTDLEKEDIEQSFTSPMKIYKSGKEYIIRTSIPSHSGKSKLKIYNEDEVTIPIEDVVENTKAMVILEIQGVRSSARNFQIDIEIKQMMVLKTEEIFNTCIFSPLRKSKPVVPETEHLGKEIISTESSKMILDDTSLMQSNNSTDYIIDSYENTSDQIPTEPIENIYTNDQDSEGGEEETIVIPEVQDSSFLCEVDIHLDEVPESETIALKERKELYYKMYEEARQKAKVARDLALSAYLEAKQIKNKYMLDDVLNSSSSDESDNSESEDE